MSQLLDDVVTYIAAFVARKLGYSLKCETCLFALHGIRENDLGSFTYFKNNGSLSYSSADVIHLYRELEKLIRQSLNQSGLKINKKKICSIFLENSYFDAFIKLAYHNANVFEDHVLLLIKSIVSQYCTTRIRFACNDGTKSEQIRKHFTHLIQFK